MRGITRIHDEPVLAWGLSDEPHAVLAGDRRQFRRRRRRSLSAGTVEMPEHLQRLAAGQQDHEQSRRLRASVAKPVRNPARKLYAGTGSCRRLAGLTGDDEFAVENHEHLVIGVVHVQGHPITGRHDLLANYQRQAVTVRQDGQWRTEKAECLGVIWRRDMNFSPRFGHRILLSLECALGDQTLAIIPTPSETVILDTSFARADNEAMESLTGIEAFARVVETGSFTAAATHLQTAKSSVSDTVRGLEERLGVRLLERTTRSVRPTDAGMRFYARCRRLLDEADAARAEVRAFQSAPAGRLRVSVPESFGERYIVPGLASFLAAFPSVVVEVMSDPRHVRLVEEEFDLAIRVTETLAPTLVTRRIGSSRVIIVAAPSYLSAHGAPETPQDLTRHQCVAMAPPLPWHDKWRVGAEMVTINSQLVANTAEGMRMAAIAAVGVVALPDWVVLDALAAGYLTRVLAEYDTTVSGIYAVYPSNRLLTPVVRAFVDHLVRDLRARGVAA
jgi:DNA-binding transcriptional LysR family regulator